MQFSIARLLLITLFVNFVLAASFALPGALGYLVLTCISLFVIPPFIIVGVVNTRGLRQSFFLGAMVSGIPHFIFTVYYGAMVAISLASGDLDGWDELFAADSELGGIQYVHPLCYLMGAIGGGFGMAAYLFFQWGDKKSNLPETTPEPTAPAYGFQERVDHPAGGWEFTSAGMTEQIQTEKTVALPPR